MVCAAGADNAEPGEKCWRIDHFAGNRLSHSFFLPVSQAWGEDTCSCEQQFLTHHGGGAGWSWIGLMRRTFSDAAHLFTGFRAVRCLGICTIRDLCEL